ncbi:MULTISPECIES: hypothetical protein [Nocardia]|uniref:hypothetical protein n=1 Tax=Nocardia TaxID=1817 RepID=UPI00189616E3|nr:MULTISPECIES: hypothetical protein [Nocardia]MBF6351340.1 hypothetical protein [Nocardia flavorosea]
MVALSVLEGQLPKISAKLGVDQSTLAGYVTGQAPKAAAMPPGPHVPGMLQSTALQAITLAFLPNLGIGGIEHTLGSQTLVPADISYEVSDEVCGSSVNTAGSRFGCS